MGLMAVGAESGNTSGMKRELFHRSNAKPTAQRMSKFLTSIGVDVQDYFSWIGAGKYPMMEFFKLNPEWTLRGWEMLVWEHRKKIVELSS